MLFNSIHFFIFFPLVAITYFLISVRFKSTVLLLASIYFYAIYSPPYLILLFYSIALTYYSVHWMEKATSKNKKLLFLNLAVWGNLLLLFVFKYLDFAIKVWNQTFSILSIAETPIPYAGIFLPMGISFYSIQAIAYAVDVYRGEVHKAKSLAHFALFLSFFPQLVAGPILRAKDTMHQLLHSFPFSQENFRVGISYIALGLFRKTIFADSISRVVDQAYANPSLYSGFALFVASCLFSVQIYCDFAGYSDIAIGTARIFGYKFPLNFREPFLAKSITEIWRRWHISLTSWLRDYIYISLGGSKVSILRNYFNIFITTFASGLWHGADWTFIIWGTLNALFIVIEKFLFGFPKILEFYEKIPHLFRSLYGFFFFTMSVIFFRSRAVESIGSGVEVASHILKRIFTFADGRSLSLGGFSLVLLGIVILIDLQREKNYEFLRNIFEIPLVRNTIFGVIFLTCLLIYGVSVDQPFLYFQF